MKRRRQKSPPVKSGKASDTRAELLAQAKRFGIPGRHRMKKAQLIRVLKPYLRKKPQPPIQPKTVKHSGAPTGSSKRSRYDDLPWSYGKTELVLMPVGPFLLYAYWDFSLKDWKAVQARKRPVILRIYDITMIKFDGTNAHQYSDVPVFLKAQNWYIPVWTAEKSLCADLGWLLRDGSFHPIVRSNVVQTPRAGVSIFEESRWVDIPAGRKKKNESNLTGFQTSKKQSRRTLALWKKLKRQAAGLTGGKATGLSSQQIHPVQSRQQG